MIEFGPQRDGESSNLTKLMDDKGRKTCEEEAADAPFSSSSS